MQHSAGYLVGLLIGFVIGVLIGGAIGAVILRLATRWVEKFTPRFWLAFGTALAAYIIALVVNFVVGIFLGLGARVAGLQAETIRLIAMSVGAVIGFLITATMIRALIRRPDGSVMGFGRACLIALVQALIGLAILAILFACAYAVRHALGLNAAPPVSI
jgi:hypothetical protein